MEVEIRQHGQLDFQWITIPKSRFHVNRFSNDEHFRVVEYNYDWLHEYDRAHMQVASFKTLEEARQYINQRLTEDPDEEPEKDTRDYEWQGMSIFDRMMVDPGFHDRMVG